MMANLRIGVGAIVTLLVVNQLCVSTAASTDNGGMSETDIAFDLPDLTTPVETASGLFQLEAYRSLKNDQIMSDVSSGQPSTRISQLFWVSVGQPAFVTTPDPKNPNLTRLFHGSTTGFSTYIQMLTSKHRGDLAMTAQKKYRVNITENQVVNLILSKFECLLEMFDNVGNKYLLKGKVSDFRHFPLRMNFRAPPMSTERRLFLELLEDHSDLEFMCSMASRGKLVKTNTLTISAQQQQFIGLEEKLFGKSSTNGPSDVFVTRDQMSDLASEMYSTLNIVEDYQIPEIQFNEAFVDGLINQIASSQFKQVPIDDVLASLSKYGFDIGEDLKPDVIKRDLGSILTIEKRDGKSRIILDEKNYKNFEESRTKSGGGKVGFLGIGASANWANGNSKKNTVATQSLNDQLRELNTLSQKDIQWEIVGEKIVPKNLNVARLTSANFGKTLSFSRIRRQTFVAPFDREFAIYTYRAVAGTSCLNNRLESRVSAIETKLDRAGKRIDTLDASVQSLSTTVNQLGSRITSAEQTIRSLQSEHPGFKNRLDNLLSRLSGVDAAQKRALRRCRICFIETEGSSQCQGNRNSCSSWSDAGAGWTQPFRDDTDSRGGGCKYQWKVECQS